MSLPACPRACKRPQNIYETYETCSRPVTPIGYQTNSLFRQHPNNGPIQGHCPPTCLNCSRSFARVGLHDKLSEVSPSAFHKHGISRICGRLPPVSLALPWDKIRNVRTECQALLNLPLVTVRQLAKILANLTYHSSCLSRALPPLAK